MADLLKFLLKSKFMRKSPNFIFICCVNILLLYIINVSCSKHCKFGADDQVCEHGVCKENYCECYNGWAGKYCQSCSGRVLLSNESGIITDGSGNYSEDNQCTWLIDPNHNNSHIRLYLDHFATECSWDHLYIYDGGSIYDPLLAVFSGMIVHDHYLAAKAPEVVAKSGRALLYFYSDAAYNLTGFSISYRTNGCPSSGPGKQCSGHGVCIEGECTCDGGWAGEDCGHPLCPFDCHGNGECHMERHRCQCHEGYTGSDCNQKIDRGWWESFPQGLSDTEGHLSHQQKSYSELERASHSSVVIGDEVWVVGGYSFSPKAFLLANNLTDGTVRRVDTVSKKKPSPRYGHSSVTYNGSIYVYGGSTPSGVKSNELWAFDPEYRTWSLIEPEGAVSAISGGRIRRDNGKVGQSKPDSGSGAQASDVEDKSGEEKTDGSCLHPGSGPGCSPIGAVGHAAVIVGHKMIVLFGHSATYGALNLVQEFHFKYRRWRIIETNGAVVSGTYGHTAVFDPGTSLIYIHGGLQAGSSNQVVPHLITYDPFEHMWSLKRPAPLPRFLHSASLAQGLLLIFGGNTHNDTAFSYGAKCFSADFLVYDIHCDYWHRISIAENTRMDVSRYGHSAIVDRRSRLVVLGGFNGRMLGSTLHYHPGRCDVFSSKNECLLGYPGMKCIWNRVLERCESLVRQDKTAHDFCAHVGDSAHMRGSLNHSSLCNLQTSCHSCLYNSYGCVWCGSGCYYEKCADYTKVVFSPGGCEDRSRWHCKSLKSCNLCNAYKTSCSWLSKECVFAPNQTAAVAPSSGSSGSGSSGSGSASSSGSSKSSHSKQQLLTPISEATKDDGNDAALVNVTSNVGLKASRSFRTCPVTCSERRTCANCTQGPCMWCFNQQRCVTNNSYLVSFPYGQCREWTTEARRCPYLEKGLSKCMSHQTCKKCQEDIGCGWCDDATGTGTGVCLEGGHSGPVNPTTGELHLSKCPHPQWYFTSCPACNCNGHSHCVNDTMCVLPCANNTKGRHCQRCKDSFFGKPINGGLCKPCQCHDHGLTCEHETGVCHCHTKGVTGDHCERCDTQNHYYGEPLKGSCFYELQIDYQFTFNLSKQEDVHIRQINFYNVPSKSDVDTDFDIQCSKEARIKISAKQTGGHETWIVKNFTGTSIKRRFSASKYVFSSSENNTTFHVYVFDFTPPIEIIISFSQHPKLDLIQFFSIFSLCFMVLLLMAFVMWKIKQKYDLYTRRQRMRVEMAAMASRPFQVIYLELQLDHPVEGGVSPLPEKATGAPPPPTSPTAVDVADKVLKGTKETAGPLPDVGSPLTAVSTPPRPPVITVKKKAKRKGGGGPSPATVPPVEGVSNGVIQRNSCNGSVLGSHPQISLQTPETKLVGNKNKPSPISLEPCTGNKAAVLSLLVQLPTGSRQYTSPGHPGGLAIASALVSLGPMRRSSLETTSSQSEREPTKANNINKNKN